MYQSFYKLSGKPFRLSPDPSFFFPSRGHKRALAYLRYGLNQDEGFVVITGAPGTGKTTLAKILLQELGDKNLVVAHLTTTQLEADDMLRMVAASFGLRYEGLEKAALLKSLEQFLLARARERKRALLVIDEAQNLPERSLEELRMLSNLQVGDKALVQTFLLGQAQFRQMLDHPDLEQLRQRVIANYHLSPLAPDECQRYIESRLHQVDWKDDPHFAEVAYEMIHEFTEGIPRRINMMCDRILLYACMEELHEVTGEVVTLVMRELENEISGELVSTPNADAQQESDAADNLESENEDKQAAAKPRQPKEHADIRKSASHAQRIEALSEKNKTDETTNRKEKTKAGKTPEPVKVVEEAASEVMGNTVTKTKPDTADTRSPAQTEIDERDLFRVIPGGKTDSSKPAEQGGTYTRPMAPAAQAQPSQEDVVLRRILRLVLAFHRSPSRFPGLDNANQPLPDGITELLELAISDDQTLTRVSPAAVMGISPMMLRAAVRFFVRRAFFVVDGDDYRVLGLQPGSPQPLIERHYDLLMRLLRQDKQRGSADSVARIGNAYEALSRLDQAAQAKQAVQHTATVTEDAEEIDADKSDELTIDFEQLTKQSERRHLSSSFGKKPHETFDPETAISHRRLRYVGQIAVLGFGALVIVLGMYIVQLEPTDVDKPKQTTITQKFGNNETASNSDRRMPLSFSDGSSQQSADNNDRFDKFSSAEDSSTANAPSADETVAALGDRTSSEPQPSASDLKDKQIAAMSDLGTSDELADTETFPSSTADDTGDTTLAEATSTKSQASATADSSDGQNMSSSRTGGTAQSTTGPVATVMPQSYPGVDIETTEQTASVLAPPSAVGSADKNTTTSQTGTADVQAGGVAAVAKPASASPATARAQEKLQTPAAAGPTLALAPPSVPATPAVVTPGTSSGDHPVSQPETVAKQATPAVSAKANITQGELNNLISRFVSAYKKGDVNKIMALFAPNARTNNRTTLDGIRADYIDLFNTTNFRDIAINSVFWEFDSQYARGVGEYRASVNPSGTNGSQTFLGKVTIQVSKRGNDLEMTRFYFSNQKVIAGTGSKAASSPLQASVAEISKIEMQNLMTQFVQYYEKGDITGLMSLFAEDARTNDQATKAGISKDYLDLFNSTDSRQLTLSNMTWESKEGIASGSGHFEVVVKGKGSDVLNTFTGIIKIEAKRDKDHIVVTKWLHNTQ